MRTDRLAWCLALVLGTLCCNDGNTDGQAPLCGLGNELCNNACVAIGSCGVASTSCPAGYVLCSGSCIAGSTCPTTSTTTGGSSSVPSTAVAATGSTTSTTTTVATSTGGTSSVPTTYVDTNPTVCDDTSTTAVTLSADRYEKRLLGVASNPLKTYEVIANWWGVWANQTVTANGLGFSVTNSASPTSQKPDDPVGYPSLYIGSYQQVTTSGSNLPMQVSNIGSIPMVFSTNITSSGGDSNAALDVWFNTDTTALSSTAYRPTEAYLMVWLNDPANRQPRGGSVGSVSIGSYGTFEVWYDGWVGDQPPCVTYLRSDDTNSMTFDLNDFIADAVDRHYIDSSWYLAIIFGGFEIWSGSGQTLNNFCAKVNAL